LKGEYNVEHSTDTFLVAPVVVEPPPPPPPPPPPVKVVEPEAPYFRPGNSSVKVNFPPGSTIKEQAEIALRFNRGVSLIFSRNDLPGKGGVTDDPPIARPPLRPQASKKSVKKVPKKAVKSRTRQQISAKSQKKGKRKN
jgi:hypothetical protein